MKKKKKRKKIKFKRLFILLLFLSAIFFVCSNFINIPIMSITINGNKNLTDKDVLKLSKLDNYPSFFTVLTFKIKEKLLKSPYIDDAFVSKGLFSVKINIVENKVLYIDKETEEKVFLKGRIKDDKVLCAPILINEVPKDKQKYFLYAMNKIDEDILCKMSEIKYDPNDKDYDRYFVNMSDGNGVYLTVNKFKKINDYDRILESIGKQNGIMYLDYGDFFEAR